MDAIRQVAETEAAARERKAQAQAQVQDLAAQARRTGQEKAARIRREAQDKAREALAQAEAEAQAQAERTLAGFDRDCEALKAKAGERLDRAAALIVGKVVES